MVTRPMQSGRSLYIVRTDRWYIERIVWLLAGIVLSTSSLLAFFVNPYFILFVSLSGLVSINVAVNGLCPVGSVHKFFGFSGALESPRSAAGPFYRMQTDAWFLERRIYMTVGVNVLIGSTLVLLHSLWWCLFTGFVGVAMLWFASTGFCILANLLYWIGAEPRLKPPRDSADGRTVDALRRIP